MTFNETVTNVTAGDFSVSGTTGTIGINNVSGTVTDVTVSGGDMANLNATITLSFDGGQDIADGAGNLLTNTTPTGTNEATFTLDNTAPSLTSFARQTPSTATTSSDTLVFRATFSESVVNVSTGDFSVSGSTNRDRDQRVFVYGVDH